MIRAHSFLCALAIAGAVCRAQDPAPKPTPPAGAPTEWPALSNMDKDKVLPLVGQLRKDKPELRDAGRKQLIALGPGAMPLSFSQVSDRAPDAATNAQLFLVFDEVLKPEHAQLMVRELTKPRVELRRYLVRRLARFHDATVLAPLQKCAKDKDADIAAAAAIGAFALGDADSLPAVIGVARTSWKEYAPMIAEVLQPVRSVKAGEQVLKAIAKGDAVEQMAGLRLLRYVATKDQAVELKGFLRSSENNVKKEAVNAMRVLHGEEPIENLSVFQVVEMANKWLQS